MICVLIALGLPWNIRAAKMRAIETIDDRGPAMADYQWAWSRFRIVRIVLFLLLIVGISPLVPISIAQYELALDIVWGLTLFLLGWYLWKWKCPRCGKRFAGKTGKWLLLPEHCASCGLQKYSTNSAAPDAAQQASASRQP